MFIKQLWLSVVIGLWIALISACGSSRDDSGWDAACEPRCWQASSGVATDSESEFDGWIAACESADSGCEGVFCQAAWVRFAPSEAGGKAVQCESHRADVSTSQPTAAFKYAWLGPEYGLFDGNANSEYTRVTGWAELPYGYMINPPSAFPTWTAATIDDALAHEVTDQACDTHTDLRACIRAFIPPITHCLPEFAFPEDDDAMEAVFTGCRTVYEPYNTFSNSLQE